MKVISIAGYITEEKLRIARDYLEKTTRETCGIKPEQVELTDAALLALVDSYCREVGVRNLQKQIEKIYRKIALHLVRQSSGKDSSSSVLEANKSERTETDCLADLNRTLIGVDDQKKPETDDPTHQENCEKTIPFDDKTVQVDMGKEKPITDNSIPDGSVDKSEIEKAQEEAEAIEKIVIDQSNLSDYVGKPVFQADRIYDHTPVGVVMGLAWTSMGGSTLYIETPRFEEGEGKGGLNLTGQLRDVMKESAEIALTVSRGILRKKEPENNFFANTKVHLHVPAGATPKDGPSAGCTMITSMLSLAMKKPVQKDLAMTGEVTLTGKILPIGGVKEKTIAAHLPRCKP